MLASLFKIIGYPRCRCFRNFSENLFYRRYPGYCFCYQREQKSGLATILGKMKYLKRDDMV